MDEVERWETGIGRKHCKIVGRRQVGLSKLGMVVGCCFHREALSMAGERKVPKLKVIMIAASFLRLGGEV